MIRTNRQHTAAARHGLPHQEDDSIMRLAKTVMALALVVAVVWAGPASAQFRKAGTTGAAFLKVGVGARAVALGSAYTTVPNEANQVFWNPAGITQARGKTQVALSYNKWIADLNQYALAVVRNCGDMGTFGISIQTLGVSGITADRDIVPAFAEDEYTPFETKTSLSYDFGDMALGVTWARDITDRLSVGVTGKMISETMDDETASSVALDVGAIYHIGYRGARLGARINNLGSDMKFYELSDPIPLVFSVGAAIDAWEDEAQGIKVTVLADATKPQDGEQHVYSATEITIKNMLSLRTGYKLNYMGVADEKVDETTGERYEADRTEEGMTFGLGLDVPGAPYEVVVDYAYTSFGILDGVHRMSLNLTF